MVVVPEGVHVAQRLRQGPARHGRGPVDGQPFQLLTRLARELDCVVGGGFVAVRGRDTYGTFVLAEPDGAVHLHDKDIPTAWEQQLLRRRRRRRRRRAATRSAARSA